MQIPSQNEMNRRFEEFKTISYKNINNSYILTNEEELEFLNYMLYFQYDFQSISVCLNKPIPAGILDYYFNNVLIKKMECFNDDNYYEISQSEYYDEPVTYPVIHSDIYTEMKNEQLLNSKYPWSPLFEDSRGDDEEGEEEHEEDSSFQPSLLEHYISTCDHYNIPLEIVFSLKFLEPAVSLSFSTYINKHNILIHILNTLPSNEMKATIKCLKTYIQSHCSSSLPRYTNDAHSVICHTIAGTSTTLLPSKYIRYNQQKNHGNKEKLYVSNESEDLSKVEYPRGNATPFVPRISRDINEIFNSIHLPSLVSTNTDNTLNREDKDSHGNITINTNKEDINTHDQSLSEHKDSRGDSYHSVSLPLSSSFLQITKNTSLSLNNRGEMSDTKQESMLSITNIISNTDNYDINDLYARCIHDLSKIDNKCLFQYTRPKGRRRNNSIVNILSKLYTEERNEQLMGIQSHKYTYISSYKQNKSSYTVF
ncbi:hypothetical protein WA158_002561 [Blastocystis sp. Blastoise]